MKKTIEMTKYSVTQLTHVIIMFGRVFDADFGFLILLKIFIFGPGGGGRSGGHSNGQWRPHMWPCYISLEAYFDADFRLEDIFGSGEGVKMGRHPSGPQKGLSQISNEK